MFDRWLNKTGFPSWIHVFFLAWLLTLPFGAKLLSFSVGFMTVYPNLLLTFALMAWTIPTVFSWSKMTKVIFLFLLIWVLYALVFLLKGGITSSGIFDLRSLIMQASFAAVIFGVYVKIGAQWFFRLLAIGFRSYLALLLLFGVFEYYTGNHFSGTATAKFAALEITNSFYAPLYIYDNVNDYLTYILFVFLVLMLVDQWFRKQIWLPFLALFMIFVFAQNADAKFAKLAVVLLLILHAVQVLVMYVTKEWKRKTLPYVVMILGVVVMWFTQPVFYGPKYKNPASYRLNAIEFLVKENSEYRVVRAVDTLSAVEQKRAIQSLDSLAAQDPERSTNLRKNLILNGIDFIKDEPIFGIGPGGYHNRLASGNYKHYISQHRSPHNLPVEIISEFGVIGWMYLLFVFLLLVTTIRQLKTAWKQQPWLIGMFAMLPILWMMPSGYLYLDIHWLFLPLMVILVSQLKTKPQLS